MCSSDLKKVNTTGYVAPLNKQLVIWSTSPTSWTQFDANGLPITSTAAAPGTNHCNFTNKQYLTVVDTMIAANQSGQIAKNGALNTLIRKAGNLSIGEASYVDLLKYYTDN